MSDKRRYGVIEVRYRPGPPEIYQLTIARQVWAAVEWSRARRTWCIEDAAGHCLAHCEHIHGNDIDRPTALALAKAMIRDGRIPPPEIAKQQLLDRQAGKAAEEAGEDLGVQEGAADAGIVTLGADGMRQLQEIQNPELAPVRKPNRSDT
jgi:hypothetical protein